MFTEISLIKHFRVPSKFHQNSTTFLVLDPVKQRRLCSASIICSDMSQESSNGIPAAENRPFSAYGCMAHGHRDAVLLHSAKRSLLNKTVALDVCVWSTPSCSSTGLKVLLCSTAQLPAQRPRRA
jgi:hypothetical protein